MGCGGLGFLAHFFSLVMILDRVPFIWFLSCCSRLTFGPMVSFLGMSLGIRVV